MKHGNRLFLLALALTVGGGLRYKLQPDSEPVRIIVFAIVVLALGEVFYQVDKHMALRRQ